MSYQLNTNPFRGHSEKKLIYSYWFQSYMLEKTIGQIQVLIFGNVPEISSMQKI